MAENYGIKPLMANNHYWQTTNDGTQPMMKHN